MNKSDNIDLLSKALVQAQAEMPSVTMDAVNPFFKSKYATLGAIIQATRPVLAKYGLAVSQLPVSDSESKMIGVETVLMHESGQWVGNTICASTDGKPGRSMSQDAGSVISYLRRYSLAAILGIYSDEDDDGNANVAKPAPKAVLQPSITDSTDAPDLPTMTLENAVTVRSTDGKMYAEMDLPQLTAIYNAHGKKLKLPDLPESERLRIERENAAIKTLIDSKRTK